MADPVDFPRFSASFDHATAAALRREAGARMERPADLIRAAVANELRVREAARAAVAAERARQSEAARRLHRLMDSLPAAETVRARVAEISRPAEALSEQVSTVIERARRATPRKDTP